jgi:hypothetical protein
MPGGHIRIEAANAAGRLVMVISPHWCGVVAASGWIGERRRRRRDDRWGRAISQAGLLSNLDASHLKIT